MKRRMLCRFLLAIFLTGSLCACARLYDGKYISVSEHEETQVNAGSGGQYYQVHTYAGIQNALMELIGEGAEEGVIRVQDYAGSVQDDIARICLNITKESAIGSYAVEYITHSVNRILSYYEVQLSIRYRLSEEERSAVVSVPTLADMYRLVDNALLSRETKMAVQIGTLAVTERTLVNHVESFYRENPDKLSVQPTVSVAFYPSESSVSKVITFDFSYRNTAEEEAARLQELNAAASALTAGFGDLSQAEYALLCCRKLTEAAQTSAGGNTAYDALVNALGDSEGFAMAYQLLCSRFGISCQVVEGRKNGSVHNWNILKLGRDYYHVDTYACAEDGLPEHFLLTDGELIGEYWWDVDRYPRCQGNMQAEVVIETYLSRQNAAESAAEEA